MIRAIADSPAPPMPTKCTCPSRCAGSSSSGTLSFIVLVSSTMRASFSSASRGISAEAAVLMAASLWGPSTSGGTFTVTHAGGEVGVGHRPPLPRRRRVGLGVQHLLAVADREGHQDRRQSDRGRLCDARGTAPADHQVGGGQCVVHPVDEADRHVRSGTPALGHHLVLGADDVQHLNARLTQRTGGAGDGGVDVACTLATHR